MAVTAGSTLSL